MTPPTNGGADVHAQWDDWLATVTDRLMSLDERTTVGAGVALDLAAAFVCRKSVASRVQQIGSDRNRAGELSALAVHDDAGNLIAADLSSAAVLLTAVLDRVSAAIEADEAAHTGLVADRTVARRDVEAAQRLAVELGHYANRAAVLAERAEQAGDIANTWRVVAVEAAALRRELEQMEASRTELFRRWHALEADLDALSAREVEIRELVELCRSKVRPLPPMAVPSVAALGTVRPMAELTALPWQVARAVMEPLITRIDRLDAAFDEVARRFTAVVDQRNELRGLVQAFRDKAGGSNLAEAAELEVMFKAAEDVLWSAPCDVAAAEPLVAEYTAAVNAAIAALAQGATDR